jgi:hypothetical protein
MKEQVKAKEEAVKVIRDKEATHAHQENKAVSTRRTQTQEDVGRAAERFQ